MNTRRELDSIFIELYFDTVAKLMNDTFYKSILDKLEDSRKHMEQLERLRQEYQTKLVLGGKKIILDSFKPIFEEYPNLISFSWDQYTPYFNDGEVCEFSAYVDYPILCFDNKPHLRKWDLDPNSVEGKAFSKIQSMLKSVDQDTYKSLFGDHVTVTVTKDDVKVSDCDHD